MGLGSLTRDSIIGLNNLVQDDEVPEAHHRQRRSGELSGSWNNGPSTGGDDFLLLENDDALPRPESQGSFETSLNDGVFKGSASTSPTGRPRTQVYSNVSATNSRSLDSYKNISIESSAQKGAHAADYQGFHYEGYSDYYSDDYVSYNDDYYSLGSKGKENKNVFCCLFAPWAQPKVIESDDQSLMSGLEEDQDEGKQDAATTTSPEDKAVLKSSASALDHINAVPTLTPTPSLKGKLPAVTSVGTGIVPTPSLTLEDSEVTVPSEVPQPNRLSAVKPTTPHMLSDKSSDSTSTGDITSISDEKKQEEEDVSSNTVSAEALDEEAHDDVNDDGPPSIKGILKVKRCSTLTSCLLLHKSKKEGAKVGLTSSPNKRHLFPTYEPKKSHTSDAENETKVINFNPMARVLTIPSRKDIPFHQKAQVWWQKCDYDEFKKTGRIISKAMECGGSEIWLASSNAWGNRTAESQRKKMKEENLDAVTYGDSEQYNRALSKYVSEERKDEENGNDTGDKWWCKFGHSRRGLEHVASSTEGRARQESVLLSIRMVMEEQKRQRATRTKDPNKLRNVSMQYTSWARDLSLAAGSADAEAVASNFDPSAKCRARHFARSLSEALNQTNSAGRGVVRAVTNQILDAYAHSTPRTEKSMTKSPKDLLSEESLSTRAKGFIPGG
mmetsp:Transcript_47227/g.100458  ORF Transcript_47227/g.100458 Transcript_47227/m.100458 type:complete len:669 (+) Transcript_47227:293-2299(+)